MLNIDQLRQLLTDGGVANITEPENQIIDSAAGYDGIVSLIQTKGVSPMVVLEHNSTGELSMRPGGFSTASQSIWIMRMVARDGNRTADQEKCFEDMKRIVSILGENKAFQPLVGWQPESIPYSIRNAGANFTGYEFTLHFEEDIDLEYHGQE